MAFFFFRFSVQGQVLGINLSKFFHLHLAISLKFWYEYPLTLFIVQSEVLQHDQINAKWHDVIIYFSSVLAKCSCYRFYSLLSTAHYGLYTASHSLGPQRVHILYLAVSMILWCFRVPVTSWLFSKHLHLVWLTKHNATFWHFKHLLLNNIKFQNHLHIYKCIHVLLKTRTAAAAAATTTIGLFPSGLFSVVIQVIKLGLLKKFW